MPKESTFYGDSNPLWLVPAANRKLWAASVMAEMDSLIPKL